jgi:MFS family permease
LTAESSQLKITVYLCLTEVLGLLSFATFPALLPIFLNEWQLSNTQAGWISAIYYAAYMLTVPLLVGITDRIDARRVMLLGAVIAAVSSVAFSFLAAGFYSALVLRFFAGVSLAGIYMPGVKLVSDHAEGPLQSRYVSFYTASFSIGASISYLLAGEIAAVLSWQWAFSLSAAGPLVGILLIVFLIPEGHYQKASGNIKFRPDFRPIWQTRKAMAYILGYAAHMWELFSLRSWVVVYLEYSRSLQPQLSNSFSATQVAFLINLIGLPASIAGNELSRRFGRRGVITAIMMASFSVSIWVGFTPGLPYGLVVFFSLVYGVLVLGDSASLTAGAVAEAPPGSRGAALALHSTLGFGAAFLGPMAVGLVLDAFGTSATWAWGMGFIAMGLGGAAGPLFLHLLGREEGSGER